MAASSLPHPGPSGFVPRTAVVTGATRGIGLSIALALRARVTTIVLVGRDPTRIAEAVREVSAAPGTAEVRSHVADLSQLAEVRRLAADLLVAYPQLDVLVNNAGAYFAKRGTTSEGIERTLALNVLSPYLLTRLLHERLRDAGASRVVNVASAAHDGAKLLLDDLDRTEKYSGFGSYGRSKLELILLTHEFARRWAGERIAVNAVHPGFVRSGFGQNNGGAAAAAIWVLSHLFGISPARGAETPVYVATSPQVEGANGEYFDRSRAVRSSPASYDTEGAARLWELCAQRVGLPASG
jgi:NAD(P)-dependent dehydrogenase (short-subunit alcohol dehydrogenase family)